MHLHANVALLQNDARRFREFGPRSHELVRRATAFRTFAQGAQKQFPRNEPVTSIPPSLLLSISPGIASGAVGEKIFA